MFMLFFYISIIWIDVPFSKKKTNPNLMQLYLKHNLIYLETQDFLLQKKKEKKEEVVFSVSVVKLFGSKSAGFRV